MNEGFQIQVIPLPCPHAPRVSITVVTQNVLLRKHGCKERRRGELSMNKDRQRKTLASHYWLELVVLIFPGCYSAVDLIRQSRAIIGG